MKNIKNKLNLLIHKGRNQGRNIEIDDENFHDVFKFYLDQEIELSNHELDSVVNELSRSITKLKTDNSKLSDLNKLNYFGEYIEIYFRINEVDLNSICSEIKIESSVLHNLINNKIRIIDIKPSTIAKLIKYLNLKLEIIKELLIKTILLNSENPSAKYSLARYSYNTGIEEKGKSMNSAINELLLKAHQVKPISSLKPGLNDQIESYIKELAEILDESNR